MKFEKPTICEKECVATAPVHRNHASEVFKIGNVHCSIYASSSIDWLIEICIREEEPYGWKTCPRHSQLSYDIGIGEIYSDIMSAYRIYRESEAIREQYRLYQYLNLTIGDKNN